MYKQILKGGGPENAIQAPFFDTTAMLLVTQRIPCFKWKAIGLDMTESMRKWKDCELRTQVTCVRGSQSFCVSYPDGGILG